MNLVQRVVKNTTVEGASVLFNLVVTALYSVILVRLLGPEQYGKYSLALSFTAFFGVFVSYGFGWLITQRVARDRRLGAEYAGKVLPLQAVIGVVTLGVMIFAVQLLQYPADTTLAICIAGGIVIFSPLYVTVNGVFRAFERMELHSLIITGERVVSAALGCWLLMAGYRLIPLVLLNSVLSAAQLGAGIWLLSRCSGSIQWGLDFGFWRGILRESFPFAVATFFVGFRLNAGMMILSKIATEREMGYFSAAFRPCILLGLLAIAYANALFPAMSRFGATSRERLVAVYRLAFKTVLVFSLPVAIGIAALADQIVPLLYGAEFAPAVLVLQTVVWIIPPMFLVYPMGNVLVAIDKAHLTTAALAINGFFSLALYVMLIHSLGYTGAAIAAVMSEAVLVLLYFCFIRQHLGGVPIADTVVKPVLAGVLMACTVVLLRGTHAMLGVVIAGFVYCVVVLISRPFTTQEISWLRRLGSLAWLSTAIAQRRS